MILTQADCGTIAGVRGARLVVAWRQWLNLQVVALANGFSPFKAAGSFLCWRACV